MEITYLTLSWTIICLCVALEFILNYREQKPLFSSYEKSDIILMIISFLQLSRIFNLLFTFGLYKILTISYGELAFIKDIQFDVRNLNMPLQYLICFLVQDFSGFFAHYCNHKVPWLWIFHEPHHSHKDYNILLEFRFHPFDKLVFKLIKISIVSFFIFDEAMFILVASASSLYGSTVHSKLKWHLPVINELLISPKNHFIHHTIQGSRKNFGAITTIWDRLFGTYQKNIISTSTINTYSNQSIAVFIFKPYYLLTNAIRYKLYSYFSFKKGNDVQKQKQVTK